MDHSLIAGLIATASIAVGSVVWRVARNGKKRQVSQANRGAPNGAEQYLEATKFDPDATRIFSVPITRTPPLTRQGGAVLVEVEARLVGLSGAHKGRSFDIGGNDKGLFIGRQSVCDIQLQDKRVSGRHAWIGIVDGKAILRDLKSTNGTYVNAKMDTPIHQVELRPGDMVVLGGHLGEQFHFLVKEKAF